MACFHPLKGWLSSKRNPTGKRSIVFSRDGAYSDRIIEIPCGKCDGCRIDKSREWAVRCVHEASLYDSNCFITLTFNDKYLSNNKSLDKADFVKFMKRLRKRFGANIRFFHCGEYGAKLERPHHHACLFNFDFKDKVLWTVRDGVRLYRSETLEKLWPFGFCTIGDVTFESAAYVARYVMKKITGVPAAVYYKDREPEYVSMSRRPGIGRFWYDKFFSTDVFPQDYIVLRNGIKTKVPKYYSSLLALTNANLYDKLKNKRKKDMMDSPDNEPSRLEVKERLLKRRLNLLKRGVEL